MAASPKRTPCLLVVERGLNLLSAVRPLVFAEYGPRRHQAALLPVEVEALCIMKRLCGSRPAGSAAQRQTATGNRDLRQFAKGRHRTEERQLEQGIQVFTGAQATVQALQDQGHGHSQNRRSKPNAKLVSKRGLE